MSRYLISVTRHGPRPQADQLILTDGGQIYRIYHGTPVRTDDNKWVFDCLRIGHVNDWGRYPIHYKGAIHGAYVQEILA